MFREGGGSAEKERAEVSLFSKVAPVPRAHGRC